MTDRLIEMIRRTSEWTQTRQDAEEALLAWECMTIDHKCEALLIVMTWLAERTVQR